MLRAEVKNWLNEKNKTFIFKNTLYFVTNVHEGQFDKGGTPYVEHLINVAYRLKDKGEEYVIAGFLHDLLEDTDYTRADLYKMGHSEEVIQAVVSVTRLENETYTSFIIRASKDEIGKQVKLADLSENMDTSRLNRDMTPTDKSRLNRYKRAYSLLTNNGQGV